MNIIPAKGEKDFCCPICGCKKYLGKHEERESLLIFVSISLYYYCANPDCEAVFTDPKDFMKKK